MNGIEHWLGVAQQVVVLLGGLVALVQGLPWLRAKQTRAKLAAAGDALEHLKALCAAGVDAAEAAGKVRGMSSKEKLDYAVKFVEGNLPERAREAEEDVRGLVEAVLAARKTEAPHLYKARAR